MKTTYISIVIVIVLLVAAGVYTFIHIQGFKQPTPTLITSVQYSCAQGVLHANFSDAQVTLTLPDNRTFTLPQGRSGSGIRYEKDNRIFIGKGDNAFFTENGTTIYADCVAATPDGNSVLGFNTFTDNGKTFSFSYPSTLTVTGGGIGYTPDWANQSIQPGLVLAKVSIPKSFQPNTNFSEAWFKVGTSADPTAVKNCLTDTSGSKSAKTKVTINGTSYTKIVFGDAGAGNFYDTTSYRVLRNNQCYAIEYTIHSTNIGNYSPDQGITEYNKVKVQTVLDTMVKSFTFI